MSKPTTIRLDDTTLARAEAVRVRSQVPITTSAVLQEAVRRGLGDLENDRGRVQVKLDCVDKATPEIDRLSIAVGRLECFPDTGVQQAAIAAMQAAEDVETVDMLEFLTPGDLSDAELKFKVG